MIIKKQIRSICIIKTRKQKQEFKKEILQER